MTPLIGISGLALAGKDSLAHVLVLKHGFKRVAFADPLKEALATIAGEPVHLYHQNEFKEQFSPVLGATRRAGMQDLGSAVRSMFDEGVWVRRALAQWMLSGQRPTVISDCRFDNEAEAIKSLGGIIVRVVRPGAGLSGEAAQHASEAGISDDLVDIVIHNDGSLDELAEEARKLAHVFALET